MTSSVVKDWFEDEFFKLSPEIQSLHLNGGKLSGAIVVEYGNGVAGFLGRRLARILNIPSQGEHRFSVNISHHKDGLHWDRLFNESTEMKSVFEPVGTVKNGYWLERTGSLHIELTVEISRGGWYWKIVGYRMLGLKLPKWLFPKSEAYKYIENGKYRFYVAFSIPIIGKLVSYTGLLNISEAK